MVEDMKAHGMEITTPDIAEFAAAAKSAHEAYAKTVDYELYQKILEEIK